jgi:hypothetical protein
MYGLMRLCSACSAAPTSRLFLDIKILSWPFDFVWLSVDLSDRVKASGSKPMVVHKVDDVWNAARFALDGDMRKEFRTALRTPMHPIGPETLCTYAGHLSHGHFPTTSHLLEATSIQMV